MSGTHLQGAPGPIRRIAVWSRDPGLVTRLEQLMRRAGEHLDAVAIDSSGDPIDTLATDPPVALIIDCRPNDGGLAAAQAGAAGAKPTGALLRRISGREQLVNVQVAALVDHESYRERNELSAAGADLILDAGAGEPELIAVVRHLLRTGTAMAMVANERGMLRELVSDINAEIASSGEQLGASLEHGSDAVFLFAVRHEGAFGTFIEVNQAACRATGRTRAALMDTGPADVGVLEPLAAPTATLKRLFADRWTSYEGELDDGKPIEVVAQLVTVNGQPLALVLVRDAEPDRRTRAALARSELRFATLVETMNEGFWIADPDGTVAFANPPLARLLGKPVDEIVGATLVELGMYPDDADHDVSGRSQSFERRLDLPDHRSAYVIVSPRPVSDEDSNLVGIFGVVMDITQRRVAEEELIEERARLEHRVEQRTAELSRANATLERAVHLKDQFLASMSHELRTPLNTILGLAEALREGIFGGLNDQQDKYLSDISRSGEHLLALITDILDVSKIEAGRFEITRGVVDIEQLCQSSLQFIRQDAAKKRIRISYGSDSVADRLVGDERRLKQVLVNLLNNAVKFTPDGGTVGLEVDADSSREVIDLTVWDTGIGINEEDQPKLFTPFVQLDSRLSRAYNGTGLGLALVRRLTELHGGSVSLESTPGDGARFTVTLPWRRDEATAEPQTATPPSAVAEPAGRNVAGARLLLAEDNPESAGFLCTYLEARGFDVRVAANGVEAVEMVRELAPDAVIMDVQMPVMDGLEAIERIRAWQRDEPVSNLPSAVGSVRLPIIAVTALAMPGDRERCLDAGADEYLRKPVRLKELVSVLDGMLKGAERRAG